MEERDKALAQLPKKENLDDLTVFRSLIVAVVILRSNDYFVHMS